MIKTPSMSPEYNSIENLFISKRFVLTLRDKHNYLKTINFHFHAKSLT